MVGTDECLAGDDALVGGGVLLFFFFKVWRCDEAQA